MIRLYCDSYVVTGVITFVNIRGVITYNEFVMYYVTHNDYSLGKFVRANNLRAPDKGIVSSMNDYDFDLYGL